jgi:DNA-binding NarL/FixJ family response regulator
MNRQERRIVIVESAPSVRNALCKLLASIEGDVAQNTREIFNRFCATPPEKLLFSLRCGEAEPGPDCHAVRNVAATCIDSVLVLTAEANGPLAFRHIHELVSQYICLSDTISRLRTFVHALF